MFGGDERDLFFGLWGGDLFFWVIFLWKGIVNIKIYFFYLVIKGFVVYCKLKGMYSFGGWGEFGFFFKDDVIYVL